jgi:TonB family protein
MDKRFLLIFLASFVAVYAYVIYLANMHFTEEALQEQIKNRYLQEFYAAEFEAPIEEVTDETEGLGMGEEVGQEEETDVRAQRDEGKRAEATGTSAAERRAQRRAQAAQRGRQRAAMEQAVAGTGILAELSAGGGGGSGDAVYDVLGEGGSGAGIGDLDQVLGGVGGLQTASSGSRRSVLGARSSGTGRSGGAGIDDLIEGGVGPSSSVSIARRGKFSIKMEEGTVSGKGSKSANRSAEAISRIVNKHADAIENCYKKEARINPNLKGSITILFTIRANGTVTGARVVDSTLQSRKVETCVIRRISRWRFDKIDASEGDVRFKQKYIFSS